VVGKYLVVYVLTAPYKSMLGIGPDPSSRLGLATRD